MFPSPRATTPPPASFGGVHCTPMVLGGGRRGITRGTPVALGAGGGVRRSFPVLLGAGLPAEIPPPKPAAYPAPSLKSSTAQPMCRPMLTNVSLLASSLLHSENLKFLLSFPVQRPSHYYHSAADLLKALGKTEHRASLTD